MKATAKRKKKPARAAKPRKKRAVRKVADERDITELMLRDHKVLKRLIRVMKNPDREPAELRRAFEAFAPALDAHAKPEQESLYARLKQREQGDELRPEGFEGQTEHEVADLLVNEIKGTEDEDEWKARVKVLAELVEHHLEEEEEEMIPDLRKELELEERVDIGDEYLRLREQFAVSEAA
jgi:hypothetical protein